MNVWIPAMHILVAIPLTGAADAQSSRLRLVDMPGVEPLLIAIARYPVVLFVKRAVAVIKYVPGVIFQLSNSVTVLLGIDTSALLLLPLTVGPSAVMVLV